MRRVTTKEFIEKAKKVHGDKYDYSKVKYINNHTKVCIICPEHGEFWQQPNNHLQGKGCIKCVGKDKYNNETIIEFFKKVHGDKYDYSKVEYKGMHTKVCIICPEHGEFWQTPANHAHWKQSCPKCQRKVFGLEDFIELSNKIHGNKYDYSKSVYNGYHTKLHIICPIHGEFWQTPSHHLKGCGCELCAESKIEKKVKFVLDENDISYKRQYRASWLKLQSLDFYLPNYNIAIECQGEQHFCPVVHFGGENRYLDTLNRDLKKSKICLENRVKIYYVIEEKFRKYICDNEIKKQIYNTNNVFFVKDNSYDLILTLFKQENENNF